MDIFAETMSHFNFNQYTKEEEEELKRDVEHEKWLDAKDMESEHQEDEPKEND